MQWWPQIGDKPRQGKRQGQASNGPDPPSPGNCNACNDNANKGEPQEIKGRQAAGQWSIDGIDSHKKPDQYGRRACCHRHGSARTIGRQAFLRRAAFAYQAPGTPDIRFAPEPDVAGKHSIAGLLPLRIHERMAPRSNASMASPHPTCRSCKRDLSMRSGGRSN
jgi:hypothetical protein